MTFAGMAKEATFGTPVAASFWHPVRDININVDPGLFYPPVMQNQRDAQIYALYGQAKYTGPILAPFFPSGVMLAKAAIGREVATTATINSTKTGTSAAMAVGATSTTYTVTTGGAPVVGDTFMFETLAGAPTNHAEIRVLSTVTGAGPYTISWTTALNFAHASGTTPANTVPTAGPFTHWIQPTTVLDSLTVEKCVAGFQSEQYPGARVNKLSFKSGAANTELQYTADMICKTPTTLGTPSVPTWNYDTPFIFAEATVSLLGTTIATVTDITLDIDNVLKPIYTHGADHSPTYINPPALKTQGSLKLVFQSLNDAAVGYFNKALPPSGGVGTQGALTITWTHANNINPAGQQNFSLQLSLPQVNFSKYADALKLEDVAFMDIGFMGSFQTTNAYQVQMQVANGQSLPY